MRKGKDRGAETGAAIALAPTGAAATADAMDALHRLVNERKVALARRTHSGRLLARGTAKVVQKLGEEVFETVIEAISGDRERLVGESADVLYHLVILWVDAGVRPEDVWRELARREGVSGHDEKRARVAVDRNGGENE